jgi:hypothetical protein
LASVALEKALESGATCLALDKETDENCQIICQINGSMVELWGNIPIFPGSQEVIASIPICSTQEIKQLLAIRSVAAFFY